MGHTHCSIDQYFSRISKAIYSKHTRFIASPLGLLHLIKCCHNRSWGQEVVIREIHVYYDIVSALQPYINHSIRYYSIPHYFILKPIHPRIAIMQYKMFSFNRIPLPQEPESCGIASRNEILDRLILNVDVSTEFALVNGTETVKEAFGFDMNSSKQQSHSNFFLKEREEELDGPEDIGFLFGNSEQSKRLHEVNSVLPSLKSMSIECIAQQDRRMLDESLGKTPKAKYDVPYEAQIRKDLKQTSNKDRGYIVWLSSKKAISDKTKDVSWKSLLHPKPFDLQEIILKLDSIAQDVDAEEKELTNFEADERNDHRRQTSSTTVALTQRSKRIYKAAQQIAIASKWVLKQIDLGVYMNSNDEDFHPEQHNNFRSQALNKSEVAWYRARDSTEKVLRLTNEYFVQSPEWEPLPCIELTTEEQTLIEKNQNLYRERIELAEKIGTDALVKIAENFKDEDQIIAFGQNDSNEKIQEIAKVL